MNAICQRAPIDTGDHWREWTRAVLDYYDGLGRPKIGAILITRGHVDHIGGIDRVQEATGAVVRCHPKLAARLRKILGDDGAVAPLESREKVAASGASLDARSRRDMKSITYASTSPKTA